MSIIPRNIRPLLVEDIETSSDKQGTVREVKEVGKSDVLLRYHRQL